MAKRTQTRLVRGKQLKEYFSNIVASEPNVSDLVRTRVADRLSLYISSARFRASPPSVDIGARAQPDGAASATMPSARTADDTDIAEVPEGAGFDPYAFSVVAVLAKEGDAELMSRLNAIGDIANLKRLAKEQRLSVPRALMSDSDVDGQTLRNAILEAGRKRIANRQAAAG